MRTFRALFLLLLASSFVLAQDIEPLRFTVRFPAPHTHYAELEASIPTSGKPSFEIMMPVWTPGSYLVREYARNVEGLAATGEDGKPWRVEKTRKNRWQLSGTRSARVRVTYRVYCHEVGVQQNWVDADYALLNGAGIFFTIADQRTRPHEVTLELPSRWKTSMTGMAGANQNYRAVSYDVLIDSPIVAGNPAVHAMDIDGTKHFLVNTGETALWDGAAAAKDVEKIAREYKRMWGFFPFDKYVFLNMIVEAGGGLEHLNSVVMMTSRYAFRIKEPGEPPRPNYLDWLRLVSHEYFHAWNVKRMRPIELGPFDYENEVYTRSLWLAEGVTSYYGPLAVRRAGLSTREQYLTALSRTIENLQTTEGRLVQPVEQSSFDSWIKLYRPDENSPNSAISYYTKGAVIGFVLDAKIRKSTNNAKDLDALMRLMYERYAGDRGYTPEQFRSTASEVARQDLSAWFRKTLESTEELDYSEALEWFGLRFNQPVRRAARATTGLVLKADAGRLLISQVKRQTPAYEAGFNVNDEVLAIDDLRVRVEQWPTRLDQYKPGDKVTFLVARRDQLTRIAVTLGAEPERIWKLEADPKASDQQKNNLKSWLRE